MMMGGKDPAHLYPRGGPSPSIPVAASAPEHLRVENRTYLTWNLDAFPEFIATTATTSSVYSLMS